MSQQVLLLVHLMSYANVPMSAQIEVKPCSLFRSMQATTDWRAGYGTESIMGLAGSKLRGPITALFQVPSSKSAGH